jgi:hypothetical protein
MMQRNLPEPIEIPLPPIIVPCVEPGARAYAANHLRAIVGRSAAGWHMSVSHPGRYPTWDEIAHLRYELLPADKTFVMVLPPEDEYVNIHPFTFHLWEAKDLRPSGLIRFGDLEPPMKIT